MKMMGAGFGLIGLLLSMGIILWMFAGPMGGGSYGKTLASKNQEAREQVQQFSGRDDTGRRLSETLTLEEADRGVRVATVESTGIAATHFGLLENDVILQIGPMVVGDVLIPDVAAAQDFLDDAFAKNRSIIVLRDGKELTLPAEGAEGGATHVLDGLTR
jgi:hypothetical protein